MKAFTYNRYGSPHNLKLNDVPRPQPKDNEVLIKIRATSINDWDWGLVRGKPYIIRLINGIIKPGKKIPGVDIAGIIENCGKNVRDFQVGQTVFCDTSECGYGGFAEYVCVPQTVITEIPKNLSFTEAAAFPHASSLAYQSIEELKPILAGSKVLINGAGGGVGTFAVQMLKKYDVHITGVDTAAKSSLMLNAGFDKVIDYRETDFTAQADRYNYIIDTKTNRPPARYLKSLTENGKYATVGGDLNRIFQLLTSGKLLSMNSGKSLKLISLKTNKYMREIAQLAKNNELQPHIEGPYEFEKIPELLQRFGEGKHSGKIVVRVS